MPEPRVWRPAETYLRRGLPFCAVGLQCSRGFNDTEIGAAKRCLLRGLPSPGPPNHERRQSVEPLFNSTRASHRQTPHRYPSYGVLPSSTERFRIARSSRKFLEAFSNYGRCSLDGMGIGWWATPQRIRKEPSKGLQRFSERAR